MNISTLSIGQIRVREIGYEVLKSYSIDPVRNKDKEHEAYRAVFNQLQEDQIIHCDRYTGCKVKDKDVSHAYMNWIKMNSRKLSVGSMENFAFSRMIFHGSVDDSYFNQDKRVFQCGSRYSTTTRAILSLLNGEEVPTDNMSISYFIHSGVSEIHTGNHRMLAYKLIGKSDFPLEAVHFFEECSPNESLNHALLFLEGFNRNIEFNNQPEFAIEIASELEENSLLCQFIRHELMEEEKCMSDLRQYSNSSSLDIQEFKNYIDAFHAVQSRKIPVGKIKKAWKKCKSFFKYEEEREHDFNKKQRKKIKGRLEQWLNGEQATNPNEALQDSY